MEGAGSVPKSPVPGAADWDISAPLILFWLREGPGVAAGERFAAFLERVSEY